MWQLSFFEDLQESVYVADMDTYEIVYVNRVGLLKLGLDSLDEIKGKKCYGVIQGMSETCEFCTNEKLQEHSFYEWHHFNKVLGKEFLLRDTMVTEGGRRYRLEIAVDVQELQRDKINQIKCYENHEQIINEGLKIALRESDSDRGIEEFLAFLGEKTEADRVYVFENNRGSADNTYEWCAPGVSHEMDNLQNIPPAPLKVWYEEFNSRGNVIITDVEKTKNTDQKVYSILKPQGIKTLIAYPIRKDGEISGFYGVDNVQPDMMSDVSVFLEIVSQFLAILIEKRDTIRGLKEISYYDSLTQLLNRSTAEKKINELVREGNGAFFILDLDGFKAVNDLFGHQKGDMVLKDVAQRMKEFCRESDIVFRIGGDEFGMFFPTMRDSDIIEKKCSAILKKMNWNIKNKSANALVGCSIGIAISGKEGDDFTELYRNADRALYEAKKRGKNQFVFYGDLQSK